MNARSDRVPLLDAGVGTRVIRAAFLCVWTAAAVQLFTIRETFPHPAVLVGALAATVVAVLALTVPHAEPLARRNAAFIAVTAAVDAGAVLLEAGAGASSHPFLIQFGMYLCAFTVLRRRPGLGWAGTAASAAIVLGASAFSGPDLRAALGIALPGVLATILGSVWACGLNALQARVTEHTLAEERSKRALAASELALASHRSTLVALSRRVRPALVRIADGDYSAADRTEFRVLEAGLRDGIRAPALAQPPLVASVRAARRRGVSVTLLDDGPQRCSPSPALLAALARQLDALDRGRAVLRLVPEPDVTVATVLLESPRSQRLHRLNARGWVLESPADRSDESGESGPGR